MELAGQRFGRLIVRSYRFTKVRSNNKKIPFWNCKCDCGNEKIVSQTELRSGDTKSCGCLRIECYKTNSLKHGGAANKTRLFRIWCKIRERVNSPNCKIYKYYGGKGIRLCNEWQHFVTFRNWAVNNGYSDKLTIERNDNDKDYCPENCRWATRKEQANNRATSRFLEYNGKIQTMSQWSDEMGISQSLIFGRLKLGWTIEQSLTIPRGGKRSYYAFMLTQQAAANIALSSLSRQ